MKYRKRTGKRKRRKTPPEVYGFKPERAEKMLSLYESGLTLQEISDKFEITRERVRQVVGRALRRRIARARQSDKDLNRMLIGKSYKLLVKDEIRKIVYERNLRRIEDKLAVRAKEGVVPEKFTNQMEFARAVGIGLSSLRKYTPETLRKIRERATRGHGGKRWSKYYLRCRMCGTTAVPHRSQGYCETCYLKTDHHRRIQEASRLRAENFKRADK